MSLIFESKNKYGSITLTNGQSKLGEFIVNDDGFYVFFPENLGGYYNEYFLFVLLDKLKELNKEWKETIDKELK